jgi:hypothetical protein
MDALKENTEKENRERIARLLNEVAVKEGIHPTRIEGVGVARHSSSQPRISVVYEPVIVFVGQGRKRSYLGDEVYEYDSATYFVLSVPLPAESSSTRGGRHRDQRRGSCQ